MAQSAAKVDIWNRALGRIGENQGVESENENTPAARACRNNYDDILRELLELRDWPWAIKQIALTKITSQAQVHTATAVQTVFGIDAAFSDPATLTVTHKVFTTDVTTTLTVVTDYTIQLPASGLNGSITLVVGAAVSDTITITIAIARQGWDYVYALPADFVKPIGLLYSNIRQNKIPADTKPEFQIMPNENGTALILAANLDDTDIDIFEYVALITYIPMMPRHFVNALAWRLAVELEYAIRKGSNGDKYMKLAMDALDVSSAHSQNMNQDGEEAETPSITARG